ncbi:MAG: DUF1615 family protein [Myxococcales bacterium]|nr:DUF1615 family protein [Myxococcales bacterium]MCB9694192.1 DUF1615 family protein [Alphaproteobacteria bacterium]
MLALIALFGCTRTPGPSVSPDDVARWVRPGTKDAAGWGRAVHDGLVAARVPVERSSACQVLAVIEQESGYAPDPAVPGLGAMALGELESRASDKLGFLGDDAVDALLDARAEGADATFRQRLEAVRTERQLDLVFRDLAAHQRARVPALGDAVDLVMPRLEERLNPVSTAGSMQVKVAFAQEHPVSRGMSREAVRDRMYTLEGGVLYGTLRLFDHPAPYEAPIFRFADFNAGQYASRNAAFQAQLADLTGREVATDGDLVGWSAGGKPRFDRDGQTASALLALGLDEGDVRRDLKQEKTAAFERTATWAAVKDRWRQAHGEPPYGRVPEVVLDSPKLSGRWTTRSFAERVDKRYRACMER